MWRQKPVFIGFLNNIYYVNYHVYLEFTQKIAILVKK